MVLPLCWLLPSSDLFLNINILYCTSFLGALRFFGGGGGGGGGGEGGRRGAFGRGSTFLYLSISSSYSCLPFWATTVALLATASIAV